MLLAPPGEGLGGVWLPPLPPRTTGVAMALKWGGWLAVFGACDMFKRRRSCRLKASRELGWPTGPWGFPVPGPHRVAGPVPPRYPGRKAVVPGCPAVPALLGPQGPRRVGAGGFLKHLLLAISEAKAALPQQQPQRSRSTCPQQQPPQQPQRQLAPPQQQPPPTQPPPEQTPQQQQQPLKYGYRSSSRPPGHTAAATVPQQQQQPLK